MGTRWLRPLLLLVGTLILAVAGAPGAAQERIEPVRPGPAAPAAPAGYPGPAGDTPLSPAPAFRALAVWETSRVSERSDGTEGNSESFNPDISADGRIVVFASAASNLVGGDSNGATDIFVHDRQDGSTRRVSVSSGGGQANFDSFAPAVSGNGQVVVFCSYATNLVSGDDNNVVDAFYHNRQTGATGLLSKSVFGGPGNDVSCAPDANPPAARGPDVSDNGRYAVFESYASDLVGNDTNGRSDIFRYDIQNGTMVRISVDSSGGQANGHSRHPAVAADGQRIAFESDASNLVSGDGNGYTDVFVRNLSTGNTRRVSIRSNGAEGNGDSFEPHISANGLFVVFSSFAGNLVSGDGNFFLDVFIRDRGADQTYLASLSSSGQQPNVFAQTMEPTVSGDGRFVAFQSYASNLAPGESGTDTRDVFLRDRQTGATSRVSVSTAGVLGDGSSREPVVSDDGQTVAYASKASNLVVNDNNGARDIFVYRREAPPPPVPTLAVDRRAARPGDSFSFTGQHFPANVQVTIYVNGLRIGGPVTSDGSGQVTFCLGTTVNTQPGSFFVQAAATGAQPTTIFYVDPQAPLGAGSGCPRLVPDSLGYGLYHYLTAAFQE